MSVKLLRWMLVCALSVGMMAQVLASSAIVCPPTPIRVGFFEFGVLFTVDRDSGRRRGFGIDRDLALELEKRSGCRFEGHLMSRARIWVEMQEGRLDMTFSAIRTPEREAMAWMIPYSGSRQVIVLSDRVAPEQRKEAGFLASRERKFAAVRGFRHSPYHDALLDRLRKEGRVQEAVDEVQLFAMLRNGSADAIVSQESLYANYLDPADLGSAVHVVRWSPHDEVTIAHVMLTRATFSAAEAEKWRALIEGMRRDGTLLAIAMRYFDRRTARDMQLP